VSSKGRSSVVPSLDPHAATLGLGTAAFIPGYGVGRRGAAAEDPTALLRDAFERGITYVDTAAGYGTSEVWLGALHPLLDAKRVRLCTKAPASTLTDGLTGAMMRLRRTTLDTVLVHSAGRDELYAAGVADVLTASKAQGLVRHTGASTYGAETACLALDQDWCDVVQVEFSILNPSVVRALGASRRPSQEVVVRSVLGQGMLTSRRQDAAHLGSRAVAVLSALAMLADAWHLRLEQLAIRFALDTPGIDVVLVGIGSQTELDIALAAAAAPPLERWQIDALEEFDCSAEDWTHPERWATTA
jgi:aryl-alcohol dehydrogenase-like predicted oxidoreductase